MRGLSFVLAVAAVSAVAQVAASPAVLFLDQAQGSYFKHLSGPAESLALSPTATVAATAALLGVSVLPDTNAATSSQLNSLLISDPFSRPRSVFLLEIPGADSRIYGNATSGSVQVVQSRVLAAPSDKEGDLEEELASLYRSARPEGLNMDVVTCGWDDAVPSTSRCDDACLELLISASSVGVEASQQLRQVMNSALDASKDVDSDFLADLACVVRAIRSAGHKSVELAGQPQLTVASFSGFQGKQDANVASARLTFVLATVSAHMSALRLANTGTTVGAVVLGGASTEQAAPHLLLQQVVSSAGQRPGARQLRGVVAASQLAQAQGAETPSEVLSTAIIVATVILLITSLVLATVYLFNMPLTRDTLLYSGGPKID